MIQVHFQGQLSLFVDIQHIRFMTVHPNNKKVTALKQSMLEKMTPGPSLGGKMWEIITATLAPAN